jgi:hypothetical protein
LRSRFGGKGVKARPAQIVSASRPVADALSGVQAFLRPPRGPVTRLMVSHQKRPHQNATNEIEVKRTYSKINETGRYPVAHNGLVAGSSPAGPTNESITWHDFISRPLSHRIADRVQRRSSEPAGTPPGTCRRRTCSAYRSLALRSTTASASSSAFMSSSASLAGTLVALRRSAKS